MVGGVWGNEIGGSMTTIVYKDGVLASDSLQCMDGMRFNESKKIFELGNYIIGTCGDVALREDFIKFLEGNEYDKEAFTRIENKTDFRAIIIQKYTREVFFCDAYLKKIPINTDFIAIGSGQDFARGALAMGATPKQAIEIAAKFDPYTNDVIEELMLEENV